MNRMKRQVDPGCKGWRLASSSSRIATAWLYVVLGLGFLFLDLRAAAQATAVPEAPQKTFVSRRDSFQFKYPASFILCGKSTRRGACQTYIPICDETAAACVAYPTARYKGYDFEGAAFSVDKLSEQDTEGKCLNSMNKPVHTESVNGVEFQTSHQTSAAMGHGMSQYSYRSFDRGACYELDIKIATSSLGGYSPGTVKEFTQEDEQRVQASLAKVLATFEFLK